MRRINVVIDPELDDRLEREAAARGISKSALIRESVEQRLGQDQPNGLAWIGELAKYGAEIESADIDTELYGRLEAAS